MEERFEKRNNQITHNTNNTGVVCNVSDCIIIRSLSQDNYVLSCVNFEMTFLFCYKRCVLL